jgi:hypothetical protein
MAKSSNNEQAHSGTPHWQEWVEPYVLDDLTEADRQAFETRLLHDADLQARVDTATHALQRLRAAPPHRLSHDLSAEILQCIQEDQAARKPSPVRLRLFLKAAAAMLFLLGGLALLTVIRGGAPDVAREASAVNNSPSQQALTKSLDWLAAAQEPSGAWDGTKHGGNRENSTGLTGLALLALCGSEESVSAGSHAYHIGRAVGFLCEMQQADGFIGDPLEGTEHDHAIATCALLEVYRYNRDNSLKTVLDGALRHIALGRGGPAGWDYAGTAASEPPPSTWALLALRRADTLEWHYPGAQRPASTQRLTAPAFSSTTTASDKRNLYEWYLASAASPNTRADRDRTALANLRQRIIDAQAADGRIAGKWNPDDRLETAGGGIYTTSMATLMLRALPAGTGT